VPASILIAEDESDVVEIMAAFLKLDGYDVRSASDGKQALEYVRTGPPDLILLDEMMPNVSGNEVAQTLKSDEKFRHIPIIMVTARYHKDDRINSLVNAGVDDYITKPFDPDELRARVKSMLRIKELNDAKEEAKNHANEMYEKASRISEARKKVIDEALLSIPVALIFADAQGRVYDFNSRLADIISGDLEALKGKNISDILPGASGLKAGTKAHSEYIDSVKGKLKLELSAFAAGESLIYVVKDDTGYSGLLNIKEMLSRVFEGEEYYGDFFKKVLSEIRAFTGAKCGIIKIDDGENSFSGAEGDCNDFASYSPDSGFFTSKKAVLLRDEKAPKGAFNALLMPLNGREKIIGHMIFFNCRGIGSDPSFKIEMAEYSVNLVSMFYENIILTARMNRENILIKSLISMAKMINSTLEQDKLLKLILDVIIGFSQAKAAALFITDVSAGEMKLAGYSGYSKECAAKYEQYRLTQAEAAAIAPETACLNRKTECFCAPGNPRILRLKVQDRLTGMVFLCGMGAGTQRDEMLSLMAEYAAKALENSFLFSQVVRQNEKLLEATETLRKTEARLIASEQLAAMGKFAAAVAHEIRTPLTIMLGGIQNLDSVSGEERQKILASLENRIIDIDHILKEMMTLAKPVTLQPEKFDAGEALKDTLNFLRQKALASSVEMSLRMNHKRQVFADRVQTEKILLNLFVNAIDSMREKGGTLGIETYDDGEYVAIKISDTGTGIPEKIRDKIFDPFFTTKKHGTGLGLYNVKRIIELGGGTIDFETGASGSVFEVRFSAVKNP